MPALSVRYFVRLSCFLRCLCDVLRASCCMLFIGIPHAAWHLFVYRCTHGRFTLNRGHSMPSALMLSAFFLSTVLVWVRWTLPLRAHGSKPGEVGSLVPVGSPAATGRERERERERRRERERERDIQTHRCACIYIYIYIYIYIFIFIYLYMYIQFIYIYIFLYIYVYKYICSPE